MIWLLEVLHGRFVVVVFCRFDLAMRPWMARAQENRAAIYVMDIDSGLWSSGGDFVIDEIGSRAGVDQKTGVANDVFGRSHGLEPCRRGLAVLCYFPAIGRCRVRAVRAHGESVIIVSSNAFSSPGVHCRRGELSMPG
jgi:hypothetical protein